MDIKEKDQSRRPGAATTIIKKNEIDVKEVIRYTPDYDEGLSSQQVKARVKAKLTNEKPHRGVKSITSILWTNLFSFFNVLLYIIAAALIYALKWDSLGSLFFLVILIANISIGLFQDFRARKMLKKLNILNVTMVTVIRDGFEQKITVDDVVLDDIVKLKLGDQIVADGIVVNGAVGVNEALLTGEPDIVHKGKDSKVLSGSFVTTGTCYYQVDTIGKLGYAQKLQLRAKVFKRAKSELLDSINALFRVIGVIVIVMSVLLIVGSLYQKNTMIDTITKSAGSLVAMIPSGMYLLTSMTLAVGVIRLGKKKTLVNEMYSIEMLARVDVLCLDKTGTITDGTMKVTEVITLREGRDLNINRIISSILRATEDENPTALAMKEHFVSNDHLISSGVIPFNSASKYSGARLSGVTYIIGASRLVLSEKNHGLIAKQEKEYLERGLRVMVLAATTKEVVNSTLPTDLKPLALIIIQDNIRTEAIDAIKHFQQAGVEIKIISGDDPISVAEIARQVGVSESERILDFSGVSDPHEYSLNDFTVYGRVRPEQKEGIIRKLQQDGKTVAMIGDGVNDVLALKAAHCSIAMGEGSAAARGVSHLVLLENNFESLPSIVDEGRRAINNLQKTWSLFLVKTTFAIVFGFLFVAAGLLAPRESGVLYPLETYHMYLWEILALGVPAFWLSMQPNKEKVQGTFIQNVMRRSIPAGLFIAAAAAILYISKDIIEIVTTTVIKNDAPEMITLLVLTLSFLAFIVLYRNSRPLNRYRVILLSLVFVGAIGIVAFDTTIGLKGGESLLQINFAILEPIHFLVLILVNLLFAGLYIYTDHKLTPKGNG